MAAGSKLNHVHVGNSDIESSDHSDAIISELSLDNMQILCSAMTTQLSVGTICEHRPREACIPLFHSGHLKLSAKDTHSNSAATF